jgi:hypothetical protein
MKFRDVIKEAEVNTDEHQYIADAINQAVEDGELAWNSKYPVGYFIDIINVTIADLTDFIKRHNFNADMISISFEGYEDEMIQLGDDPINLVAR